MKNVFLPIHGAEMFRKEVLDSSGRVLVFLFNRWDGESKKTEKVLESLPVQGRADVKFCSVDGHSEAEIMAWLRILNTPEVLVYEHGEILRRKMGLASKTFYLDMLNAAGTAKEEQTFTDTFCDTWPAVDGLGRKVAGFEQAGGPRKDKFIAMFYFISYGFSKGLKGPYDVTKILKKHPDAEQTPSSPPWGEYTTHHWGESVFGYYQSNDEYVLRKHAQMLSDALVDVIVFDLSNVQDTDPPGAYFKSTWTKIFEVFSDLRAHHRKTPQIAFLLNFWAGPHAIGHLYDDLYSKGRYSGLWFLWEGKPLILYDRQKVGRRDIRDFFTFRRPMPDYFYGPTGPDQWSWSEIYPQHGFKSSSEPEKVEQVSVSVAENAVPDGKGGWTLGCMSAKDENGRYLARGRSFCGGTQPTAYQSERGLNFSEQTRRVFELDPKIVFVTGWNEWVASRMSHFLGFRAPTVLVDQYNEEFSRDIEPERGKLQDHYYYQLVDFARRFKGVRPQETEKERHTIEIGGDFSQWDGVKAIYYDDAGDALNRNFAGYGNAGMYVDHSARNDFTVLKAACDDENVYFYARTADAITPCTGKNWMLLAIGTDSRGLSYRVNGAVENENTTSLEEYKEDSGWSVRAGIPYRVEGNQMHLSVPRGLLGLKPGGTVEFDFKWYDNIELPGSFEELYTRGDTAPNGRFCYHFRLEPSA